ncbi:TonB-dependent receptor [Cellvibrio fontiphilus]|uniref:TonB-dependent receptor n=1 Tax=Cellvibrio fontiphilus TaxID=1815559 RepID=A0ABV7FBJ7_9GAMM
MPSTLSQAWARLIGISLILVYAAGPRAEPQTQPASYNWQLPAQPLGQALTQVARQLQTSLWFDPRKLQGLTAPAVAGQMSPAQVLDKLLAGSGFQALPRSSGWLIQQRPHLPPPSPEPPHHPQVMVEQLLVLGNYSRNQQTAIDKKRTSNRLVDKIIAEDIAKFPAHNIAEAIQRSPGISVVRDRGEALFLSIRGLPTQFNRVSLNGHSLAVNENVRNSEQYGRRFHYDTFPAELVAGVEVRKSTAASDEEGAIGGSVDIRPFAPLTIGEPRLSLSASANSAELVDTWRPKLAALGSWVNSDQTLGFSLAAAYNQRHLRQDRVLNFRWEHLSTNQLPATTNNRDTLVTPAGVRPTLELEQRERLGLSSSLQWQPSESWQLDVHWLQLQQQIDYQEYSYSADYNSAGLLGASLQTRGKALVAGSTHTGSVQIGQESAGLENDNSMLDISLGWQGEIWQLNTSWVNSRAHSGNPEAIKRTRLRRAQDVHFDFAYHTGQQLPQISYNNIDLLDPGDFPGRRLEWRSTRSSDSDTSLKLDATRPLDHPLWQALELGLQWRQHRRDYWRKDRLVSEGITGIYFPSDYFIPLPVANFLGNTRRLPHNWLAPKAETFWQAVDEHAFYQSPLSAEDLQNSYRIREDSRALYLQLNMDAEQGRWPLRGDVGLRWVETDQQTQGGAQTATYTQRYGELLPAANLVLELDEQLLWRSALARVMARPEFQDLAPRLTLNSGDVATATSGNPELKPVTGWQWDSALEYYPADKMLLSVGIFAKKLDNFFQSRTRTQIIKGTEYELTSPDNGARANIAGIELAWQQALPEPLQHWGINTNYTHTWTSARYYTDTGINRDRLADVARNSVNLGIYRETSHWHWRAHYNWRDQVLNQVASANLAAQNSEAFGTLDMHLSWRFNSNLSFTAEATNLTNAAQWESVLGGEFAGYTHYGRSFWVGVNLKL